MFVFELAQLAREITLYTHESGFELQIFHLLVLNGGILVI